MTIKEEALHAERPGARAWDPLVRLTHWGIMAAVAANALLTEEGSSWHVWVGAGMAGLLGLRLLWGLIGPVEARFSAFPPSPARAIRHLADIANGRRTQHRSHNGLGALMAYAIWATLLVIATTGFAMSGIPPVGKAPTIAAQAAPASLTHAMESDDDDHSGTTDEGDGAGEAGKGGEWLEELHEGGVNLLYALIALHLLGVSLESVRSGPQVVRRMIGRSD